MKIYELDIYTGKRDESCQYQFINREKDFLIKFRNCLDSAKKVKDDLPDLKVWVIRGRKKFDFSILWEGSCLYLVNEKAIKILEPLIGKDVEFIPVGDGLHLINVLCVADALDLENIKATSYGRIKKFSFKADKLPRSDIFRVMYEERIYSTALFVTEKFKEAVETNDLTGFRFNEIGDF